MFMFAMLCFIVFMFCHVCVLMCLCIVILMFCYVNVLLCLEWIYNRLYANMPGYVMFCYIMFWLLCFSDTFVFMYCFCYAYVLFVSFLRDGKMWFLDYQTVTDKWIKNMLSANILENCFVIYYVYVLVCLCFVMFMFCYVYVLLCLCFVMFMFSWLCFVMFMFCHIHAFVMFLAVMLMFNYASMILKRWQGKE